MKFHCSPTASSIEIVAPIPMELHRETNFFHPSSYICALRMEVFGQKFEIFRDNSSGRVVELQTRIARKYRAERCGTSLKIKSLSQIPPNPENSSPDTRFCSFFLYGQIFSSLLACSIELFMDRAFSRDFLDFFFQYFL